MFYQCPQCKKTWQYPLIKCPDCFIDLEKQESKNIKVIGVSKNTIPTIMHPDVPFYSLVLEDKNENRWVYKSEKKYEIGDELRLEKNKEKDAVAIWRVKYDILEAIEKVMSLIKDIKVRRNTKILILPTLIKPKHPYLSFNTSPQFLAGTLHYLIRKGANPKNIKVASQSFSEIPIEALVKKAQILKVCQKAQAVPLDLSKTKFIEKKSGDYKFEISEEFFKNDLIINLPILSLDPKIKIKGAVNNILKSLKKESYSAAKYLHNYEDLVINLERILPQYLNLAEAITIQKENQHTVRLGLVLAGFNSFNIDRVFAKITSTKDVPEFLKSVNLENIPVVGRKIKEVKFNVREF